MGTVKLYILDHLCYNIYRLGIVGIDDAFPAEHSHQLIKRLYQETSKREASANQETVHRFNTQRSTILLNRIRNRIMNDQGNMRETRTKEGLKTGDTAFLVRYYLKFSLQKLMKTENCLCRSGDGTYSENIPVGRYY